MEKETEEVSCYVCDGTGEITQMNSPDDYDVVECPRCTEGRTVCGHDLALDSAY